MSGSLKKYLMGGIIMLALVFGILAVIHVRIILASTAVNDPSVSEKVETESAEDISKGPAEMPQKSSTPQSSEKKLPTLWEILKNGGLVMLVLFIISIITIALIVYYALALTRPNFMPPKFMNRLQEILTRHRFDEAMMFCRQNNSAISKIVGMGIESAPRGHTTIQESMSSEGARQASSLWQKISYLNDIAIVSPMLGLLGTVVGMLESFLAITYRGGTTVGTINPAALANGVAKALITTVAGLIVGIVATIAYAFFRGVVQRHIVAMELAGTRFANLVEEGTKKKP